jgi:hypothetical protein
MIKMIVAFISLFVIVFTGTEIFRRLTGKEKLKALSLAGYSLSIAAVVTLIATLFVILF